MKFSEKLKQLRKVAGYTQEELASKIGVTPGSIGLYEQERREPDNDTLIKLASIFDVSIDTLLGLSTPDKKTRFEHSLGTLNTLNYSGQDESKTQLQSAMQYILDNISDETQLQQIKMFLETYKK